MNESPIVTMSMEEAIKSRRSVRGYLSKPVPDVVIRKAFELAQLSPSNSNIQPWWVFVASGTSRDNIQKQVYDLASEGESSQPDFAYPERFDGAYRNRQVDCGMTLYHEMGIAREDRPGRVQAMLRNFQFFDAPHMAFICMGKKFPATVAVDLGAYVQTLMLAFTALGVSSCAMGAMREFSRIPRKELKISENLGILLGLAFGYEDISVAANKTRIGRIPIDECVSFYN